MTTDTINKKRKLDASGASRARKSSLIPHSTNPLNEDGTSKCFHKVSTSLYVSLAPSYIQDPIAGVKTQHLDPLVMSYYPPCKGIILGYFNIRLNADNKSTDSEGNDITVAKITNDTPFAFLWVNVEFLVWRPQIGDIVEGWIFIQTQSHIGLLIHDSFNASIKKFNIPSTWEFVPNQIDEIDGIAEDQEDNHKVRSLGFWKDENGNPVDGKIRFTIKALHTAGRVVSVEGTSVAPGSEPDSLPVTASSKQHKKFDESAIPAIVEPVEPKTEEIEFDIPKYEKASDTEVVAEENSSSSDDSDSD